MFNQILPSHSIQVRVVFSAEDSKSNTSREVGSGVSN